jgi:mRNA interferase RelE/StbE
MAYAITFEPLALRQLSKLDKRLQSRIESKIYTLAHRPRPPGVKKLQGYENTYRIRVGDYRVLYEIHDKVLVVLVVEVVHRGDAYN